MGKYDAINFFIPNANGPVVIPCAGPFVPGNETVKLLKTAANNKVDHLKQQLAIWTGSWVNCFIFQVINSVSDECLKCICHPFHQCNKPRACTPSSAGCGYFAIGKDYWMTAGQPLAANLTTHGGNPQALLSIWIMRLTMKCDEGFFQTCIKIGTHAYWITTAQWKPCESTCGKLEGIAIKMMLSHARITSLSIAMDKPAACVIKSIRTEVLNCLSTSHV